MTAVHGQIVAGRWRLGEPLGRGAVADVVEVVDDRTGAVAAMKVLRADDPDQRARFQREVQVLRSLDHPAIVGVLDEGEVDGHPFVVLDRVDGRSLAAEIAAARALPAERVVAIGAVLADALDHAHRRGVVHRDVKPSNVLLDGEGRPHLADFGVVQLDGASGLTRTGFIVGTAAYLAPEQLRGEPVGPPADVYALGLVLVELLTGERVYPGADLPAAMARLDRPPSVPAWAPAGLGAALRAMTATEPDDRPSAATVAAQLGVLAAPPSEPTALLPIAAAPAPPWWRNGVVAAACFAIGFVLVLGLRLAIDGADAEPDRLDPAVPSSATVTTVAPATTAPPPSTTPTTQPADDDDDNEGRGGGNGRGSGRGEGGRDD